MSSEPRCVFFFSSRMPFFDIEIQIDTDRRELLKVEQAPIMARSLQAREDAVVARERALQASRDAVVARERAVQAREEALRARESYCP